LADTLVSAGVVISGLVIWATGWSQIDTIMSWVIALMIILSTWSLFKDSIVLSLDGVPKDIDIKVIKENIEAKKGVTSLHHIHIWALSTTENAMTAHLVIDKEMSFVAAAELKKDIKHLLLHQNIQHVTLELEKEGEDCAAHDCTIAAIEVDAHDHHHHH
jgi:cobalt-zinc-cadmium efflux system protein